MPRNEPPKPVVEEPIVSEISHPEESLAVPATGSSLQDIIMLDDDSDMEQDTRIGEPERDDSKTTNVNRDDKSSGTALETDKVEEPVSLSDLSTSSQKRFQSSNQNRRTAEGKESGESISVLKLKPFDYTAALRFGDGPTENLKVGNDKNQRDVRVSVGKIKSSPGVPVQKDDETGEFREGRRRQAFPATGNRSATFR